LLLAREAQAVLRAGPSRAFEHLRRAGTAGGALPKATVALLADGTLLVGGDVTSAAADYPDARLGLLKLDCDDNAAGRNSDGRVEHAYMTMARAAGIRTAATETMTDTSGSRSMHHLFVERFDCVGHPSRRLHVLTLAGALDSHRLDYRNLLFTTRQLSQDQAEVREAVRRMIFNVRGANADDHGKNHSFLYDERTRTWALSPAYDVTFNADEGRDYRGLSTNTFGASPHLASLVAVAADAGVPPEEFAVLDGEVASALERWPEFAKSAGLPEAVIHHVSSVHSGIADGLIAGPAKRRTKRRKLWE
jgi:serine/threonine-protein kinase HipA